MKPLEGYLPIRLCWDGRKGVARSRDVSMTLRSPPALSFRFVELDYSPGACQTIRRERWQATDDLLPEEAAKCLAFLAALDGPDDAE